MPPGIGYSPPNAGAVPLDPATGLPMLEPGLGGGLAPPQMRTPPNRPPGPGGPPGPGAPPMPGGGPPMPAPGMGPPGPGAPPMPGGGPPMPAPGMGPPGMGGAPALPPDMGIQPGQGPLQAQQPQQLTQLMQGGGRAGDMPQDFAAEELKFKREDPEGFEEYKRGGAIDFEGDAADRLTQRAQAEALRDTQLKGGYGGGKGGGNFVADSPFSLIGTGMKQYAGNRDIRKLDKQREQAKALQRKQTATTQDLTRSANARERDIGVELMTGAY